MHAKSFSLFALPNQSFDSIVSYNEFATVHEMYPASLLFDTFSAHG